MSTLLAERLPRPAGNGAVRVWLKSSAYTRRLLLGSAQADPWASPAQYLAYFSQAHGLLKPDVAVIEVGELFDAWLTRHGGLESRLGNRRRPATALRRLLEIDEPKAMLTEVVEAVLAHLRGQVPLVLALPSPRHWLRHANRLAGQEDSAPDADTVEDAAMYLADLLRCVSTLAVGGLLLEEQPDDRALSADDVARYRSVINVVRHYRWAVALRLPAGVALPTAALADFDAVIGSGGSCHGALPFGRDISTEFAAGSPPAALGVGEFYFAQLDSTQQPEAVLDMLAQLRRTTC